MTSPDLKSSQEKWRSGAALLAAGLLLLTLASPMLQGRIYALDDLGSFHLPFKYFYSQSLQQGEGFAWCPKIYCGFHLLGQGEAGVLHPVHLLLYAALPFDWAFGINVLLPYVFAFAGMFLLLKRFNLLPSAALFGSTLFAFSGFFLFHLMHLNHLSVAAHIPWLLLGSDLLLRSEARRAQLSGGLLVAVFTASQLLLHSPQFVVMSVVAEAVYASVIGFGRTRSVRSLLSLSLCKGIGVLMAAAQLLPSWEYFSLSSRSLAGSGFSSTYSLHPLNLLRLLHPYLFAGGYYSTEDLPAARHEFEIYNGAIVLPLLLFLVVCRGSQQKPEGEADPRRRLVLAGLVTGLLGTVLALGHYGLIYEVFASLPVLRFLRCPSRYVLLLHLATAVLSALALHRLSQPEPGSRRLPVVFLGAVLSVGLTLAALVCPSTTLNTALLDLLIGSGTALLAAGLILGAMRKMKWCLPLLILFAALEMGIYGCGFIWQKQQREWQDLLQPVDLPYNPSQFRIHGGMAWPRHNTPNIFTLWGHHLVNGYPQPPRRRLSLLRREEDGGLYPNIQVLRLSGTRTVLVDPDPPDYMVIRDPLPRARLVTRAIPHPQPAQILHTIDIAATAITERELALAEGVPGEVRFLSDKPGEICLQVRANTRQLLVVSESHHSGWGVTVDNKPGEVLRVYGDFMGCVVGPGKQEIRFTFAPASNRTGMWISLAATALLGLCFGFGVALSRGRPSSPRNGCPEE